MAILNKTFRIFVSSTFSDLKEERNALQRDVFPELKKLCMRHGYRFQAIDLRWGVREESALDQQTMNICLDEVARCQRPPNPNFIVLLGDRYGWQPLPAEIPASEFEQIENLVSNEKDKALLKSWYKRDDNALPAVYCIQPREVQVKADATDFEKKRARDEESKLWDITETSLRRILRDAIENISFKEEQKLKYISSATEQEIQAGALSIPDAKEHVFSFFRKIEGLPQDESAKDYTDLISKEEETQIDTYAQGKLDELRNRLEDELGNANIFRYDARWEGNGVTTDHIKKLCDDVYNSLSKIIEKEIGLIEDKPPLEREIDAHEDFGKERAKVFVGRVEILKKIQDYISTADKHPLAVYGESGTGKSALMAYSLQQTQEKHPDAEIICRFIGATPESSDGRALLESLCEQIYKAFNYEQQKQQRLAKVEGEIEEARKERDGINLEYTIPGEMKKLPETFHNFLAKIPEDKQLIIFLDALDQLSDADNSRNLNWLPAELPENIRLIVSTLPGECYEALERKMPEENLMELFPMQSEEGEELLDLWLNDVKRALQTKQRKEILDNFNHEGNGKPLYLKLAFEESRRWKSYTEEITLKPDILGVIQDLFKRLSLNENHGEMMVSRCLGYLAAAKNGLSEDELIDVLSKDKEVFDDFKQRSFHEPPEQRLPVVIWSRLYFDLEPYLTERNAGGASLMTFYHPTTFGAKVKEEYLSGKKKIQRHQGLAEYFGKQSLYIERYDKHIPNLRKLSELPFQQTYGNIWKELYNTLTDTEFLEQKNTHFIVYDLLNDYQRALGEMPEEDEVGKWRSVIQSFSITMGRSSYVFKENPELTFPYIYNCLQWQFGKNILLKNKLEFEKEHFKRPWLHVLTEPFESSALIRVFSGHTFNVSVCAFSPDGRRIVSGSTDKTLKLWDVETGEEISTLKGHTSDVNACAFSPDGRYIISSGESLKLSDGETGEEISNLKGNTRGVKACTFSPDGRRIVSISSKTIKIWDVETGEEISKIEIPTDRVDHCSFSPDCKRVVSSGGLFDKTLKLWDVKTGEEISTFKGHTEGITACAFSPDGSRIVSGSFDDTLKLWDAETGVEISTFKGHTDYVSACAFSPDGRRIVSGSGDDTLKLWDVETGEEILTLIGHADIVNDCSFSPDGKYIASASSDDSLKLWYGEKVEEISNFKGHTGCVRGCAFSPDGRRIVSKSSNTLKLWDVEKGEVISTLEGHSETVIASAFSPDGWHIILGSWDKTLKLWDAETGEKISTLKGHTDKVGETFSFSPDGRRFVSINSKTPRLWDVETGEEISILTGHNGNVSARSFSPDGWLIVTGGWDKTLKLWDGLTGEEISTLVGHTRAVDACVFSPDGRRIVSISLDDTLKLWDVKTGAEISTLKGHTDYVEACSFSPDGRRIVSASQDKTLKLWDAETGEEISTLEGHTNWVKACSFSPDGRLIVSGSLDKTLKLWDGETGEEISTLKGHNDWVVVCAFSPDGSRIVLGDRQGQVLFLSIENVKHSAPFVTPIRILNSGGKNGKSNWDDHIKATCHWCGNRSQVSDKILDLLKAINRNARLSSNHPPSLNLPDIAWEEQQLLSQCLLCHKPLRFNRFIVDNKGQEEVFKSKKKSVAHFNLGYKHFFNGKDKESIEEYKEAIRFDPDHVEAHCNLGISLNKVGQFEKAIGEYKIAIRIKEDHSRSHFNLGMAFDELGSTAEAKYHLKRALELGFEAARTHLDDLNKIKNPFKGHAWGIEACAFSPDGRRIVSGSVDRTLKLWDVETGEEIFTLKGHAYEVEACAFSPDGRLIVSGSNDKTLKLWDVETGEEISTLNGHTDYVKACAFSPDGRRIVSASWDKTLKLWEGETGERISTLKGHTGSVRGCAFSPDGRRIVSASEDKTLKLWDVETGEEISTLKGHSDDVKACVFSPDGRRIVSGSYDYTLKLWDAETGEEIFTLKGHTDYVVACAFSPDVRRIVSASWDKTLKLWDGETGEEISTLKGHTAKVTDCAFSPDGSRIVSASSDKTLKLWDGETGEEISSPSD